MNSFNEAEEYYLEKNIEKAKNKYLEYIEYYNVIIDEKLKQKYLNNFGKSITAIAMIYLINKEYDLTEYYLLYAKKINYEKANYNLGVFYQFFNYNMEKSIYYYNCEVATNNKCFIDKIFNNLGNLYFDNKYFDMAEKYYLLAITYQNIDSLFNLGLLYHLSNKILLAKKYYLKSLKFSNKAQNNYDILINNEKTFF